MHLRWELWLGLILSFCFACCLMRAYKIYQNSKGTAKPVLGLSSLQVRRAKTRATEQPEELGPNSPIASPSKPIGLAAIALQAQAREEADEEQPEEPIATRLPPKAKLQVSETSLKVSEERVEMEERVMPVVVPPPPELDLGASSPPSSLPTSTVAAPAAVTPQKASPPPKTPVGKSPKSPMEEQIEKQQAELLEAQKQMAEMRAQLTSLQEQQKAASPPVVPPAPSTPTATTPLDSEHVERALRRMVDGEVQRRLYAADQFSPAPIVMRDTSGRLYAANQFSPAPMAIPAQPSQVLPPPPWELRASPSAPAQRLDPVVSQSALRGAGTRGSRPETPAGVARARAARAQREAQQAAPQRSPGSAQRRGGSPPPRDPSLLRTSFYV